MIDLMKIVAALLVLALIFYASYKTISYAQRNLSALIPKKDRLSIARGTLTVIAAAVGIVLASITWKLSENQSIAGLPFPWSIWDDTNGYRENFINPLPVVVWAVDLIFGAALPHLPISLVCVVRRRKLRSVPRRAI